MINRPVRVVKGLRVRGFGPFDGRPAGRADAIDLLVI
jgi:hypothetical protein